MGDGFGMMDFVLIALILCGIYWFIKRRRAQAASSQYYSQTGTVDPGQPSSYVPSYGQQDVGNDLGRGIGHIRQMDPSFNEKNFQDMCMDYFFKIQGAWINRDMAGVKGILADEIFGIIQRDAEKLKAEKKINCLDNIAVRSVDLTEAWQEEGKDFVTVKFYANLLDYTTDETTGQIVSGSKTEPVKFEEYWTFVRPVGANSWQLSAIQQVA
jgi:predicted lipid-binding transport protein (Tim44 family)